MPTLLKRTQPVPPSHRPADCCSTASTISNQRTRSFAGPPASSGTRTPLPPGQAPSKPDTPPAAAAPTRRAAGSVPETASSASAPARSRCRCRRWAASVRSGGCRALGLPHARGLPRSNVRQKKRRRPRPLHIANAVCTVTSKFSLTRWGRATRASSDVR